MTNEAVCIEKSVLNDVMRTCTDANGIEKGTLLWLYGVNTVSGASLSVAGSNAFGGIATAEKVALDGSTKISCAMNGVYDLKCTTGGFPAVIGSFCVLSGSNLIAAASSSAISGGCVVGKIEETGTADDTIRVRLLGY